MTRFLLRDFVPQRKCWYHRKLTAHQRLVWEALAAKCLVDGKGELDTVRIGTHDLAHRTGLHRCTVQRIIANFERFGWLTSVEAGGGRGHVAVRRLRPYGQIQRSTLRDDASGCLVDESPPWELYEALADECKVPHPDASYTSSPPKPGFSVPTEAVGIRKVGFVLTPESLEEGARESTFASMVAKGWLEDTERQRLLWFGVIARARRVASNACAFVAGVVRQGLWRVVSDDDIAAGKPKPPPPVIPRSAPPRKSPDEAHGAWKWLMTKVTDSTPKELGGLTRNWLESIRPT